MSSVAVHNGLYLHSAAHGSLCRHWVLFALCHGFMWTLVSFLYHEPSLSDLRIYNGIGVISLFTRWFGIPFSLAEEYSVLAGCCLSFTLRHFNNLYGFMPTLVMERGASAPRLLFLLTELSACMLLHHGALSALASLLGLFWDERHLLTYYSSFAFQYPFAGEYLEAIRVLGCLFLFLFIFPPFYFVSLSSVGSQALFIASGFLSKMVSLAVPVGFLRTVPCRLPTLDPLSL